MMEVVENSTSISNDTVMGKASNKKASLADMTDYIFDLAQLGKVIAYGYSCICYVLLILALIFLLNDSEMNWILFTKPMVPTSLI